MTTTFDEAFEAGEVIALADNQMLRSMRDIRKRTINRDKIERLYAEKELLRKRCGTRRNTQAYTERLKVIKDKINRTMYMPDYVTVVMDHPKHYDYIFRNGITINGSKYYRFSCSAGQARVSTVVLCNEEIIDEMERRLNNGRDLTKKLAPSKFNAYFGLAGSATYEVSEPRFIVVKDYENTVKFMANFVTECDWDKDDDVDQREVKTAMNRTDGMGLISPRQAEKWAKELGLDYIPAQWIIRQSYLKGMVCTFPIHEFCEEVNGGNYLVDTIYQDENGEYIKADLREVDLIVSESQFKLWDSYQSVEQYVECCHQNKLTWGVASYSPKQPKDVLTLNYQFIQTLDLDQAAVEGLCQYFVNWIQGVSYDNWAYMLLFLMGTNVNESSIQRFMRSGDKWWLKALVANPEVKNDPFIKRKIRELVVNKIQNGCMGEIIVPGNFQMMVSDPYAYMEHVCGLPVTGLLGAGEYYSNYWNERGVEVVNTARSPQTYRCENVVAKLVKTPETEKWYRYCYSGFIVNWWGHEAVNWGGCDYDGDIVASTSCQQIIDAVYQEELTVTYDAPKPSKKVFDKQDLFNADKFSFGSAIGSITNKGTNAYALLPLVERDYGRNSTEYKVLMSRLQQCCVAQSKQIDKAKIGQKVKCIPEVWTKRQRINEDDPPELIHWKETMNHILLDRRPYFFKYRYSKSRQEWRDYEAQKEAACQAKFNLTIQQLIDQVDKSEDQVKWLHDYYEFAPLIDSDSPMNMLCHHIERIDFEIKSRIRNDEFDWTLYLSDAPAPTEEEEHEIIKTYKRHIKDVAERILHLREDNGSQSEMVYKHILRLMREKIGFVCSNPLVVTNVLVKYLYHDSPKASKTLLWDGYGRYMMYAVQEKLGSPVMFPMPCSDGDIEYLGKRYQMQEVSKFD